MSGSSPALRTSKLEPVPVEGCRICLAAANRRSASRCRGDMVGIRNFNDMIRQHPHRRATDGRGAEVNADYPGYDEPPIRSALCFPPCQCGVAECPDAESTVADKPPKYEGPDDRSCSPTMQRLRPSVEKENRRWGWGC